jgi:O-antigen ligase
VATPSLEGLARGLLFLFAVALPLMQPPLLLFGLTAAPVDALFAPLAFLSALLLLRRQIAPIRDPAFLFIAAYFGALLVSAFGSSEPLRSAAKLGTQLYLLALPLLVCLLVQGEQCLRRFVKWWLAGTAFVVAVALASLVLFVADRSSPLLSLTLFHFGTLPPGDYPRLRLTFLNANMACNYLSVSLLLLLGARQARWIRGWPFLLLGLGILLAAATTISPGLGGIALALGLWAYLRLRDQQPFLALLALSGGLLAALLFLAALAFTPILHPTAPFLLHLPWIDLTLAPSGRMMVWMEALRTVAANPLTGRGIGLEAVEVAYLDPSGGRQRLTDAHNIFLSVAAQAGLLGLASLLALLVHLGGRARPFTLAEDPAAAIRLAAGLGLLSGFVYQGLGGSFEDARHLWLLVGLLLAASRSDNETGSGVTAGARS